MEDVPYIDTHALRIDAPADAVWAALVAMLGRGGRKGSPLTRALALEPARASRAFSGRLGDSLPGFEVVEAEPARTLVLRGRHRFSRYALRFDIADGELRAESRAAFPGLGGKLYRAAVIGSGAHRVVVRGMLRRVARAAGVHALRNPKGRASRP